MDQLHEWRKNPRRKPLVLNGARQVGKTWILKEFGASDFDKVLYINLELNPAVGSFFEIDLHPQSIIRQLETYSNSRVTPENTLIILDEIQSCPRAVTSLKAFCEDGPEYYIATAGSLLGVAVNRDNASFPVGKIDELTMFPMDFEEFLWATGSEMLGSAIREHYISMQALPEALHLKAIGMYKQYLVVGGMPASVNELCESGSLIGSSNILTRITNDYIADMAKYSNPATSVKIRACYNSIPSQLAKENHKFQYKIVQRGGTATIFGESIEWLVYSCIALKCQKVEHGNMPISAYADLSDFKLYMGDIGLLTMKSGIAIQTVLSPNEIDNSFLGAIAENYVAMALTARKYPLHYWKNDNTAELDFLIQSGEYIIPLEVKKGRHTRSVSLSMFMKKYKCPFAYRISLKNFGSENNIRSIPLYSVFCI